MEASTPAPEHARVQLRHAEPSDAEAIARNHLNAWVHGYAGLLPDDGLAALDVDEWTRNWTNRLTSASQRMLRGRSVVVAEDAGSVVAHMALKESELWLLYVGPDCWRRGIGRELLVVAERIIAQNGHDLAELYVLDGNQRAIAFYEASGWDLDGTTKRDTLWGMEMTWLRMTKALSKPGHVAANRALWNEKSVEYAKSARRLWASPEPVWGELSIPDSCASVMPDVAGKAVIELGCGTGYISAWCHRAGARSVVGLDNSPPQLQTARTMQREFNEHFPLILADAEQAPLRSNQFDVAISEYGAAIWCDPNRWIPEAARMLRPGGTLVFLGNSVVLMLSVNDFLDVPATATMQRSQRDMHRMAWPDDDGVEFCVSHGEMIRLLRKNRFEVVDLIELYPQPGNTRSSEAAGAEWASKWPIEEVWVARLLD